MPPSSTAAAGSGRLQRLDDLKETYNYVSDIIGHQAWAADKLGTFGCTRESCPSQNNKHKPHVGAQGYVLQIRSLLSVSNGPCGVQGSKLVTHDMKGARLRSLQLESSIVVPSEPY